MENAILYLIGAICYLIGMIVFVIGIRKERKRKEGTKNDINK